MWTRVCKGCHKVYTTDIRNKQYCEECSTDMAKTIRHAEQTKEKYHEVKSGCAYVKCVCPRCDKVYKRMIQWSGHGMPRYYCNNCRMDVENDTTGMVSIMTIDTGWTDHWYKEADDDK